MALKIRLARRGTTNAPFYHVVVADARAPRDGEYLEKLGTYNPLAANAEDKIKMDGEKAKAWMAKGAQPTDRVAKILGQIGAAAMPKISETPNKSKPKKKAQDRADERAKKAEELKAAAEEAKAKPAAPAAEEAPAAEATSEEAAA